MTKEPDPARTTVDVRQGVPAMTRAKHSTIAMARQRRGWRGLGYLAAIATAGTAMVMTAGGASAGTHDSAYRQVNMVSDIPGLAAQTDPDLVNSWGVSASPGTDEAPGSALWVSDNHADRTTLYSAGSTATTVTKSKLVVTITSGAPTGQVNNADTNTERLCAA